MKILIKSKLSPHKYKDNSGYLICQDSILARTGKQSYMKSELFPECADNNEVIEVDRKPEQVFADATLASFENKPLTIEHPSENVTPENYKEYSAGFVRDVRRGKSEDGQDVIIGNIVVTDPAAIEAIESGDMTDLSCGYDCDITEGDRPEQVNIRGNHVALCQQGRAGIAKIVDSAAKIKDVDRTNSIYDEDQEKTFDDEDEVVFYKFVVDKSYIKDIHKLFGEDIDNEQKVENGIEYMILASPDILNYLTKNNIQYESIKIDDQTKNEIKLNDSSKYVYTVFNCYGKWCGADYDDYHSKNKDYTINNLPYCQLDMNIKYIVNRLGIDENTIEIIDKVKYIVDSLDYSNELYEKIIKELNKTTNKLNKQTLDQKKKNKSDLLEKNYNESKISTRSEINGQLRYFKEKLENQENEGDGF